MLVNMLVFVPRSLVSLNFSNLTENNVFTPVNPNVGVVRMLLSPPH